MKLPKTLTNAILAGIIAANFGACTTDVSYTEDLHITVTKNDSIPSCPPSSPFCCPACGMG